MRGYVAGMLATVLRRPHPTSSIFRVRLCALCLTAMLCLATVAPTTSVAANIGGGGALSELTEGAPEETKTSTTATTTSTSSSEPTNSHTVILLVVAAAIVLLSGIAFAIVRDARRVAPATEQEMIQGSSASETAARLRRRREKAKAARKQRKRNR
jgi:multidrug efflux pump subunit AcrB